MNDKQGDSLFIVFSFFSFLQWSFANSLWEIGLLKTKNRLKGIITDFSGNSEAGEVIDDNEGEEVEDDEDGDGDMNKSDDAVTILDN